jgi:hypothetical protein
VVPTIGFKLLYGFVIIRLDRRDLVWINVTTNPTAEWVAHVRGFALCLYTEEGNWDIVGNDTPVFPPTTQLRHYHVHSHHVELGSAFLPQCGTIWLNQVPQRGPSWRPN